MINPVIYPSVLVFKTNIDTSEQFTRINNILSQQTEIKKWNIDMDDCDRVLRIETLSLKNEWIVEMLKPYDIYCEELE